MAAEKTITKDTSIAEAIRICEGAPEIFSKHGMGCSGCLAAAAESIEEGANMHGADVQVVVDELNAALEDETE